VKLSFPPFLTLFFSPFFLSISLPSLWMKQRRINKSFFKEEKIDVYSYPAEQGRMENSFVSLWMGRKMFILTYIVVKCLWIDHFVVPFALAVTETKTTAKFFSFKLWKLILHHEAINQCMYNATIVGLLRHHNFQFSWWN
jgi:hypothetical protein